MLCSGSVSGEVRVWSVATSTCVGCFQAHSGATEALTFLDEGRMLLTAGADQTLHLWSGGLGRSVAVLKHEKCEDEPPRKKHKSESAPPAALCVAVNGDYVAVGYHIDGIKLFSLDSGKQIWASQIVDVSVKCLRWLYVKAEQTTSELLVSSGNDLRLRVWKKKDGEEELLGGLDQWGIFGYHSRPVLATEQSSSHLATASDDGSVCLWSLSELAEDPSTEPCNLMRGHTGGVTCLSFSPDGGQLLTGGKDMALLVWDLSESPAVLSKSLPHSHRDWITGCVWTPDRVISSSNDGRLCLWDLQAGRRLKEISWPSPLTSVCCQGPYVMAGCAKGSLHVWNWETSTEVSHIAAHQQRINHCSVLQNTDKSEKVDSEEMTVVTASDDGSVQIWKPLQVEHLNTFQGHSGSVHVVVPKQGLPEFLTVSEDCSLRSWTLTTDGPSSLNGLVTALFFSERDDLLFVGYEFGLVEIWQNNTVVGHKQTSAVTVTAICSMPDNQFAVGYMKPAVDVWKLVWNQQRSTASLVKVNTYKVENPVVHLMHCSVLIGVSGNGGILNVSNTDEENWGQTVTDWKESVQIITLIRNDQKSMWLLGVKDGEINVGFLFYLGPKQRLYTSFTSTNLETHEEEKRGSVITAVSMDKEFLVCGDIKGNMWFIHAPQPSTWRSRKPAHSDRISVLRLTDSTIISASHDRTVKLWDRNTKKQVGMFVCRGPVLLLELNPKNPNELVCVDGEGKLYFLSWKE